MDCLPACGRSLYLFSEDAFLGDGSGGDSDGQVGDGASSPEPWGRWTQSLAIAPCVVGAELVVNTTSQELEGGSTLADPANAGSTLSFVEAITIAVNRGGTNTILFDSGVFPIENPTPIHLDGSVSFPMSSVQRTCIDGRGRGVVIEWSGGGDMPLAVWGLGTGSRMIGLTLLGVPFEISVFEAEVAGCRIDTDGQVDYSNADGRMWSMEITRAQFGPGNVLVSKSLRVWDDNVIRDSYFGVDAVSGLSFASSWNLQIESGVASVTHCRFATTSMGIYVVGLQIDPAIVVQASDNSFRTVDGAQTPTAIRLAHGTGVVGPGNDIQGFTYGVVGDLYSDAEIVENNFEQNQVAVSAEGPLVLRRNRFHNNTTAVTTANILAPPVLTLATSTRVEGTCATAGQVELFLDDAGQADRYLDAVVCTPSVTFAWDAPVALPSGNTVTATLTDATPQTSALSQPVTIP